MDIVIPYRHSKEDEELRFALRSIEKHLSGYGRVFIVGDKPSWIQNVEYLNIHDYPNHKQSSLCNKVLAVCGMDVSDKFIRWDDDHFLLKPLKAEDIKYWYSEPLSTWITKRMGPAYRDVIQKTFDLHGDKPYYDIHVPIIFDKDLYKQHMSSIANNKTEVLIKSTYCYLSGIEGTELKEKDLKIDAPRVRWEIARLIEGRTFFTVGEHGMTYEMKRFLVNLYPSKSKYEK